MTNSVTASMERDLERFDGQSGGVSVLYYNYGYVHKHKLHPKYTVSAKLPLRGG